MWPCWVVIKAWDAEHGPAIDVESYPGERRRRRTLYTFFCRVDAYEERSGSTKTKRSGQEHRHEFGSLGRRNTLEEILNTKAVCWELFPILAPERKQHEWEREDMKEQFAISKSLISNSIRVLC